MFHFAGFRSLAVIWFALLLILATTGCKHGGGGGARIAAEVTVTGSVVTPAGRPIAGLTVRVVDTQLTASSDSVGRFRIDSVVFGSNGTAAIEFDASTGVPSSTFRMRMPLQRTGQPRLHLSDPIVIPMTQPGFGTRIHAATSQVAGAPAHPGAALTIAKDSVDFAATDGRTTGAPARKGEIQMVYMPRHQLPGPMPGGQVSDVVFSIQPSGIAFDPPAPITFPNYDGFAAGEQVPIMQVDPKTGEWQQVGTATVNQAGTLIVSNPGSGARWGSCTGCCFPPCLGNVVGQVTVRTGAGVAQPLANASVRVSTGHATTDAEGRYRMVGVAVGNCNAGNGPFEQQAVASWEPTEGGQSPLREERTVSLSPDTDNTVDFEFDVLQLSFVDDGNDRQGVVGGTAPTSATITSVVADNERDGGGQRHGTHVQVLPGIAHDIADDAMLTIAIDPSSDPGDRGSLVVDSTLDDGRAGSGALLEERQSVEVAVRDLRSRSKTVRYVAPAVFLPGEIDPADGREVHRVRFSASITQTTAEGTQTFGTREPAELRIVRPQLFFVHGTLSSRGAWTNDGSLTPDLAQLTEEFLAAIEPVVGRGGRDLFEQITADYSAGHQQPVEELASLVLGQLEDHRRDLQRAGIAATRFDLVAHSYGGLIVRDIIHNCAGDPNAAQRVRRLGTLGTPHLGAALADRILNLCDHNVGGARAVLDETVDAVNLNLSSVEAWADFWQGEYGSILRSTTAAQVTAAIEATWASSAFGTSIFTDAAAERRMSSGLVPGRDTRLGPLLTHGLVPHVKYVMGYGTRQPRFDATDGLYALFGFSAGSVESFGDLFISEGSARAGNRHLVNEVLCEGRQHSNLTLIDCIEALVARLQSTGLWGQIPDPVPERRGPVLYWVSHVVLDPTQPYDLSIRGANLFTPIENGLRLRLPVVALSPGLPGPVFGYRWVAVPSTFRTDSMVRFSSTNNPLPTLPLGMFYAPGRIQIDVDGQFTNEVYIKFGNHWTAPAIQSAVPSASGEQVDIVVEHDLATLAEPIVTIGHAPVRILGQTALPRTATRFRTLLTVETPATSGQLAIEVREGLGPRSNALRVDIASSAASLQPAVTCVGMPVTITGARFGYDPNRVVASIGGIVQPVTQAAGGQMMFLVQDGTSTGPLQISIDGIPSEGAPVLTVAPDNDRDGMPDAWELTHGLATDDPRDALQDLDGDGLDNRREYQLRTNPRQTDSDAGGLADGLEVDLRLDPLDPTDDAGDPDHDNLPTPLESTLGTDPTRADTDNDGLGDGQEHLASLGFATSPLDPDTDDDGLTDGAEVLQYRTNPLIADTDGDGLSDGDEIAGTLGEASNPLLRDSDGDGLDDRVELETHRTSPTRADTDGDGLLDRAEIEQYLTDPRSADTDGDTLEDGLEVALGLDPRTATPTTTVIGRVQLPDGAPAAGVDVTLDGISSSLYATTTDAAGAFLLTRCPALSASPAGPRNTSVTASIRRPGGGGCFSARSPVRVAVAGGTTDLGIVRLATAPDQPLFPITAITPQLFGPFQILPVDLDVDGAQDLVAVAHATGGASNVSLHPGRGCGLYGPERLLPLGHAFQVTGPALQADLEGDGLPELLVPHAQGFTVFPNRRSAQSGLPVLGEAVQVSMTVPANALVALDVDLDQDLDLVAFTNANGTMRVIRNQGALALVPQPGQTLGFAPGLAVTGDFDRDGGVDIVVSEEPTGAVRFLRNAGDGSFAVVATHMAGSRAGRLRATDLDANGELDVLCHDYLGDQMAVLLNRGGVMTRSTFATPQNAIDFDIADLDGDGDIDLVFGDVGTSGLPPGLQVFRNNGLGGFAQPVASPLIDMPETLVLTDADGDGNADAIVGAGLVPSSNPLPPKLFGVHRGFGDGTFEVEQTYEHDALSPWRPRVAMGDVTGDGRPDMVVARNDILEMRQGLADGRFGVVIQIHDGTFTYVRLALADLDGANGLDIVVGDTVGNVIRFLNQGNGVFGAPVTRSSSTSIDDIVIFDVDRDGQVDAVTCGSSNGLYFWRNQGGGTFAAATVIAGTAGASFDDLLAEDLDGDGWRDLAALVSNTGALFLLRNNPSGLIVQPQLTVRPSSNSSRQDLMVAADLDDDGLRELAVVSNAILATPANVVQVLANLGSWQFGAATTLPISVPFLEQFRSIAAADFNLDNRTDLAVAGRSGILLLERTGVRTFTTREHCRAAGAVEDLLCVDVDDDQRPDLVLSIQDRLSGFKEAIQVVLHRR